MDQNKSIQYKFLEIKMDIIIHLSICLSVCLSVYISIYTLKNKGA